jgi:hypothetical protein
VAAALSDLGSSGFDVRLDCRLELFSTQLAAADRKRESSVSDNLQMQFEPSSFSSSLKINFDSPLVAVDPEQPVGSLGSGGIPACLIAPPRAPSDMSEASCSSLSCASFGPDVETGKRTFMILIHALHTTFPGEFDFYLLTPSQFSREESFHSVASFADTTLASSIGAPYSRDVAPYLWRAIVDEIDPKACEIFSLTPDGDCDPFGDDSVWSFTYLILNQSLNRLLLFSVRCVSHSEAADELLDYDYNY